MRQMIDEKISDIPVEDEQKFIIKISPEEQIEILKAQLASTDYKALKYFEGWLTDEEYAPIKAERQAIRDKINELEQSE